MWALQFWYISFEYWKTRVIQTSRGEYTFSSPSQAPISIGFRQTLQHYQLEPSLDAPDKLSHDIETLHALAESATQGLHHIEARGCSALDNVPSSNLKFLRNSTENFAIRSVWDGWSIDIGHEPSLAKEIHVVFNVLYGGSHLAAWSSFFPSPVESWLWRGSALFLTTVPLWGLLWILWWRGVRSQRKWLYLIEGELDIVAAPFFFAILVIYTLARCYFLVEALMSLRLLPSDAYSGVQWTSFFPHVS